MADQHTARDAAHSPTYSALFTSRRFIVSQYSVLRCFCMLAVCVNVAYTMFSSRCAGSVSSRGGSRVVYGNGGGGGG